MLAIGRLKAKLLAPFVRSIFSHQRRVVISYPHSADRGMLFSTDRSRSAANCRSSKDAKESDLSREYQLALDRQRTFDAVKKQFSVLTPEAQADLLRKIKFGNKLVLCDDDALALPYPPGIEEDFWGTSKRPPFWDRHNAILTILNHAFTIESLARPPALICIAASGYGKTRLLAEWGIRALQSPAIINAFLNGKTTVDTNTNITTPVIDQLEQAKKDVIMKEKVIFLVRLHQTLLEQRVLYGFANKISTNGDQLSIQEFMLQNLDRFKGLKLQEEPPITISRQALKDKDDIELLEIFDQCVTASNPKYIPLVQIEGYDVNKHMTLIIIDDCQDLLPPDFDSNCTNNYKLHQTLNEFVLYARTLKTKFFVTMGGTTLGNLEYLEHQISKYHILYELPLGPLLSCRYLDELCQNLFGCKLATSTNQLTTKDTLSFFLSAELYKRWIYCCGVPKAIEYFAKALATAKGNLKNENLFLQTIDSLMQYAKTKLHSSLVGDTREKLLVEAAFCMPKQPTETVGSTDVTYQTLEASGTLIPYTFPETKSNSLLKPEQALCNYTMPFYFYPETLKEPILSFSQFNIPDNLGINYELIPITLQTVVQSFKSKSDSETNFTLKGNLLEDSAAVALWLRYKLAAGTSEFPSVPLNQIIDFNGATGLDGCWKGVIRLIGKLHPQSPIFRSTLDIIKQNHLIVVNDAKSGFAEVIVPLYKGEAFAKFMYILCHNVGAGHKKISPSAVHKELQELIKQHNSDLFAVLSPNIPPAPLSTRTAKNKEAVKKELLEWEDSGQIAVHNGDGWLSPWFVHTFREISETKWLV